VLAAPLPRDRTGADATISAGSELSDSIDRCSHRLSAGRHRDEESPPDRARLSELDDRTLFLALHHLGWHGLVTNNYKMLDVPAELGPIVRTQAVVVAVEGLGHDPLRAVGALLLELPGVSSRVLRRRSNVFRLAYRRRMAEDARTRFQQVAERRGRVTTSSGRKSSSATTNSRGLASPRWGEQLRVGSLELQATSHP